MIDPPQIVTTDIQRTASIRLTLPRAEIRNVMGPGIGELMDVLDAQNIAPVGPWFTHHMRMEPDIFDFEICVPVAAQVAPMGRVLPGQLPATTMAQTTYHGPYEGLGAAWGEFDAWIAANGLTPASDLWECYAVGPESDPNPAHWQTQLNRPLALGEDVPAE